MKKIVKLLTGVALVSLLAGCGAKKAAEDQKKSGDEKVSQTWTTAKDKKLDKAVSKLETTYTRINKKNQITVGDETTVKLPTDFSKVKLSLGEKTHSLEWAPKGTTKQDLNVLAVYSTAKTLKSKSRDSALVFALNDKKEATIFRLDKASGQRLSEKILAGSTKKSDRALLKRFAKIAGVKATKLEDVEAPAPKKEAPKQAVQSSAASASEKPAQQNQKPAGSDFAIQLNAKDWLILTAVFDEGQDINSFYDTYQGMIQIGSDTYWDSGTTPSGRLIFSTNGDTISYGSRYVNPGTGEKTDAKKDYSKAQMVQALIHSQEDVDKLKQLVQIGVDRMNGSY